MNAEAFKDAITNHFLDKNTILIPGTYRGKSVNHYYSKTTKINVICKDKKFLSCWKLSGMQQFHIMARGSL
ncbi:colicin D domain-containing protein [Desulfonema magnum]|uniref:Colicin D immunity protein domain-containing protein n=1 Tax=Desulfonema magnum TaxID=45655 RepID=A0A975BPA9_9BACT|nr:Colicin D immunity protein domain-containing protein [Desulfonema magnum]